MSDPKLMIRVDRVCRADGRCPECGLMQAGAPWPLLGLCGCRVCPTCLSAHLLALLTEALRQLSVERELLRDVLREAEPLREERDAAIRRADNLLADLERINREAGEALVRVEGERDDAIRERDEANEALLAEDNRELLSLRLALDERDKERERAEKAEALLRECEEQLRLDAPGYPFVDDDREALLTKIRGFLGEKWAGPVVTLPEGSPVVTDQNVKEAE